MKRFSMVGLLALAISLVSVACQAHAYSLDFEGLMPYTPVMDLQLAGMEFSGSDWQVVDLSQASHPPATLSNNTIGGCQSSLTIVFDKPQHTIGFNFEISSDFTDEYLVSMVAYRGNTVVGRGEYQGAVPGANYLFPEGYAFLSTQRPFDKVGIFHNAPTNCLYIDNIETTVRTTPRGQERVGYKKVGQVRVTAPGTALYDMAGGGVVRDTNGQEIWIPNQTTDNASEDVYDVINQTEIDGELWVQIFLGGKDSPWIRLGNTAQIIP